jgi:hypothetical protein
VRFETPAERLFFSTVLVEGTAADGSTWTGTGFLINVRSTDGLHFEFMVTNKHVLEGATSVAVRFVLADATGDAPTTDAHTVRFEPVGSTGFTGHADPRVDVAVMFWKPVIDTVPDGRRAFFTALHTPLFLDETLVSGLDAIAGVTFIGYPAGLFDSSTWLPVARRGQTATPIENDYRGEPAFLIDASVFPGSSGSPVFLLDRPGTVVREGGVITGGWRVVLAGVVAAVHQSQVLGSVTELPAANLLATMHVPMGLGIVYKASTILDCVEDHLAMHGSVLERTPYGADTPWGDSDAL